MATIRHLNGITLLIFFCVVLMPTVGHSQPITTQFIFSATDGNTPTFDNLNVSATYERLEHDSSNLKGINVFWNDADVFLSQPGVGRFDFVHLNADYNLGEGVKIYCQYSNLGINMENRDNFLTVTTSENNGTLSGSFSLYFNQADVLINGSPFERGLRLFTGFGWGAYNFPNSDELVFNWSNNISPGDIVLPAGYGVSYETIIDVTLTVWDSSLPVPQSTTINIINSKISGTRSGTFSIPQSGLSSYGFGDNYQGGYSLCIEERLTFAPITYFDTVQKVYIGYYQRPADPGGLVWWAQELEAVNGNLNAIIEAFANSAESQALYGTINSSNISTVVNGIYNTLFGRNSEAGGLNFYVNGFNSGQFTAATIMLNVLYGAQNEDLQSINNKLTAANLFTRTIDPELDGADFQVTYAGDSDAIAGRNFLNFVTWDSATVPTQDETTAYIKTNIANPGDPILNP